MYKMLIAVILSCFLLSGCAITKWVCSGNDCIPYDRAKNKCLAQANAAFSKNKSLIWKQCMIGEGYQEEPCAQGEHKYNTGCQVMHVF